MNLIRAASISAAALVLYAAPAAADMRSYELPAFDSVSVTSGIDAEIIAGTDVVSVWAKSDDIELLDKLEMNVRNGELVVEIDRTLLDFLFDGGIGEWLAGGPAIEVHIEVPVLNGLEAHAGADVTASGMVGDALSIDVTSGANARVTEASADFIVVEGSSGASAKVSGACQRLQADVSSGARLSLDGLVCNDVRARASSGARSDVQAIKSIDAEASSGASIDVIGRPADIEVDTSSGGDVDFLGG